MCNAGHRAALCIVLGWQATTGCADSRVQLYEQHWTISDTNDWSVDAEMRVRWVDAGRFGFKSIADPSLRDSISGLRVSDESGNAIAYQSYTNTNGWTIVKVPTPPALVIVRYKIAQAVCAVALKDGGSASHLRFAAPWAGYWTIPVTGISYSFTPPPGAEQLAATVVASVPASFSYDGSTTTLTQPYTAQELKFGGAGSSPHTAAFEWSQLLSSTASQPAYCSGGGGSGGLERGAIAGIAATLMVAACVLCFRRWKQKQRQQEHQQSNQPGAQQQISRDVPIAAVVRPVPMAATVQPVPIIYATHPVSTVAGRQAPGNERVIPVAKLAGPAGHTSSV